MMTTELLTLNDIKDQTIEQILYRVIETHQVWNVVLPDGAAVLIYPKPALKPLPVLEGFIPSEWKDAIYDPDHVNDWQIFHPEGLHVVGPSSTQYKLRSKTSF